MTKPTLLSITLYVPFSGIPHAGGEYVRRHYAVLGEFFNIVVVAPGNAENLHAASDRSGAFSALHWLNSHRPVAQFAVKIVKFFRGVSLGFDLERSFWRQPELLLRVKTAKVVEFQWTESASLIRKVRSIAPSAKTVLVAHDIVSQRWVRQARTSRMARRAFYYGRAYFTRRAERRRFAAVDQVIVFSEKDAVLVRSIAPSSCVSAVDPPLADVDMENHEVFTNPNGRTVLFTGAFSRPENHEAAMWLLDVIWPEVLKFVPDAKLILAGADPLPELKLMAERVVGVTVTGYVEDLGLYYRAADVFVSPLLHGAGVKFKNITAMLWGLPILTTPVGAEGIGDEWHYLAVTDDAEAFGAVLVRSLLETDLRSSVSHRARDWVCGRYGQAGFRETLKKLYL